MERLIAPALEALDLETFMREALTEADAAGRAGEVPIGAVVVIEGEVVSRGHPSKNRTRNQIRHAELNAILGGGEPLWRNYEKAVLFTTVEPCPLCLGAAVMADIPHIIYALPDYNCQSAQTVSTNAYVQRHIRSYYGGVLMEESAALFNKYDPDTLQYISKPIGQAQLE